MGAVFKARNWKLGRTVALKLIRKDRLSNPDTVRRFQREVLAAAAMDHPNVVRALDADEVGGTHLLVMEYVEGTDLAKLVKQNGPLPVARACDHVRQAALGLQHAHERGLVHRDIKPSNLLLAASGNLVKVLDFGLARLEPATDVETSSTLTGEGTVMGTADYLAPEQSLDARSADVRADLYSLGCTLYFLLTGTPPFPGGTLGQKIARHLAAEPDPVERLRPGVPPALAEVVRKLMAKRPEDRYQTPAEAAAALAACGRDEAKAAATVAAPRPAGDTIPGWSAVPSGTGIIRLPRAGAGRRRAWRVVAGIGVLALAGLLILIGPWHQPEPEPPTAAKDEKPAQRKTAEPTAIDRWVRRVAALRSPEQQIEEVVAKLKERNPGFDGKVQPTIEGGVVTGVNLSANHVTDLAPLRALPGLRHLACNGSGSGKGRLADLTPLAGMKLTTLDCYLTKVADLTPLRGMKLTRLHCSDTKVADLTPLQGMPLAALYCNNTEVADLAPLKDMKLAWLECSESRVADLTPLKGMPLGGLYCNNTNVADLTPLKGMKLTLLQCAQTKVGDLTPLKGMPLKDLWCDFRPERDAVILRSIKTLDQINGQPAAQFLNKAGDKPAPRP
jgi:tRNA A-37 threonylcarbamoyl transferase component Bud32